MFWAFEQDLVFKLSESAYWDFLRVYSRAHIFCSKNLKSFKFTCRWLKRFFRKYVTLRYSMWATESKLIRFVEFCFFSWCHLGRCFVFRERGSRLLDGCYQFGSRKSILFFAWLSRQNFFWFFKFDWFKMRAPLHDSFRF